MISKSIFARDVYRSVKYILTLLLSLNLCRDKSKSTMSIIYIFRFFWALLGNDKYV